MALHPLQQLAVRAGALLHRVIREGVSDPHDIPVVGLEAEVLMFKLAQALQQQDGSCHQHQR